MSSLTFGADVQLTRQGKYFICYRTTTFSRVTISARLKELVEREDWAKSSQEDLEEIRALRELGFLVEKSSLSN